MEVFIKFGIAVVGGLVALYLVSKYFDDLKQWAQNWLKEHKEIDKLFVKTEQFVANIVAAAKRGLDNVEFVVFGRQKHTLRVISVETKRVPLDQAKKLAKKFEEDNVLAC